MENSEFLEQIQRYTVRIGKREDKELYGSGTLFFISKRKRACVLTAAHIVYSLIGKIQKKEIEICLTFRDNEDKNQNIIIDDSKCIYVHSKYKETSKGKNNYLNDLALIDIPWKSWMDDMKIFRFDSGNSGIKINGYGFPMSLDEEKDRGQEDIFFGMGCFSGTIEFKHFGRLAVKYDANTVSDIDRDSVMEGYSGTGLFSNEEYGIIEDWCHVHEVIKRQVIRCGLQMLKK